MKRRTITVTLLLALVIAACGGTAETTTTTAAPTTTATTAAPTTTGGETTTTASEDPLAEFGESTDADMTLVEKALGDVEPSDEGSWNIILASVARAHQDLAAAGIDIEKALECWSQPECDTGTGGEIVMGYADGGGNDVNVWRSVSHMEAVLQALTYPEIGAIVSTAANFSQDLAVHVNDIRFLIQREVDFIVGYPDAGIGLAGAVAEAEAAGISYVSFSAGYVGLPDQAGALIPGEDYLTVVGENLCDLGESFSEVLNTGVGSGKVALLGGTPNNALTLGWQRCTVSSLSGPQLVNPPVNQDTTAGDTSWFPPIIPDVFRGLLTADPDIAGYAYEYADGVYIGLQVYEELGIPVQNLTLALRTDEQTLFCDWAERNEPTYNIWYSAGGNFQSRTGVTAAMMSINGAEIPATIIVPHVMRQVTAENCDPERVDPLVSGTSLIPDDVLAAMFAG